MHRLLLSLLALVPGSAILAQEATPAPQASSATAHSALTPAERLNEPWWKQRFEAANARIAAGDAGMIFIGDSITQGWEGEGKAIWEERYAKRKAVNLGFSGDRTQHVLWRLERHGLEKLAGADAPKLVVLMIGTNNSNGSDNTAQEIGEGIGAVVQSLRSKLPATKILILAVFPRGTTPNAQREKNAEASRIAAKLADGKLVHYLDIGPKFLAEDGSLDPAIMPDYLHLSPQGYQIWADSIEAKVAELLGEKD